MTKVHQSGPVAQRTDSQNPSCHSVAYQHETICVLNRFVESLQAFAASRLIGLLAGWLVGHIASNFDYQAEIWLTAECYTQLQI